MKQGYTHITCVIDKSGSMHSTTSDTIGGFDAYMKKQKEAPGKCTVDLILFNDHYSPIYTGKDISEVPSLKDSYWAGGNTALHDTVGKAINELGFSLAKMPEEDKPEKVIFIILTDGLENASREFSGVKIKEMIKHQEEKYKWEFVYLGANQDAVAVGSSLSINAANSMTYVQNSKGISRAFDSLAQNTVAYRSGGAVSMAFTEEDIKAQTMGTL